MNPSTAQYLAMINVVEANVYGDEISVADAHAIEDLKATDVAVLTSTLLGGMQLVYAAVQATGSDADEEWAVGYAFRAARAALLGDPAPRLLPPA